VKTNIGHLEAAAGIASVIKTALALHHEEIPRHLHLRALHRELSEGHAIALPQENVTWPRCQRPRHAGVSTFGFGGSHAHVILSEAPTPSLAADGGRPLQLLTLSARTRASLIAAASRFAAALDDVPFADALFSAKVGRKHFNLRKAFVAENAAELSEQLRAFAASAGTGTDEAPMRPRLFGVFALGAGSAQRGLALYEHEPEFRRAFDRACGWLGADASGFGSGAAALAVAYARFELLQSWGLQLDGYAGSGAGEYLAAAAGGLLTWAAALQSAERYLQLMASLVPGALATQTIHRVRRSLASLPLTAAKRPVWLGSRGEWLAPSSVLEAEHFAAQLYRADETPAPPDIEASDLVLDLSDGANLRRSDGSIVAGRSSTDEYRCMLSVIGSLYECGFELDWRAFERAFPHARVSLPGYPFARKLCWQDPPVALGLSTANASAPALFAADASAPALFVADASAPALFVADASAPPGTRPSLEQTALPAQRMAAAPSTPAAPRTAAVPVPTSAHPLLHRMTTRVQATALPQHGEPQKNAG
jgi:acyl transferase domain-containing protein